MMMRVPAAERLENAIADCIGNRFALEKLTQRGIISDA